MTPEEWSAEVLRREREQPGRFPPNVVARARELGSKPGVFTAPEQVIEADKPGPIEERANRIFEPVAAAGQAYANSSLAGIPNRLQEQSPLQKAVAEAHPTATKIGDFAGMVASPIAKLGSGLVSKLSGLAPRALPAADAIGRIAQSGLEAAGGAGVYSGARTASEGGSLEDVATSAGTGAAVGLATGGALQGTVGEMAGRLRGLIREKFPEIGQVEAGGARTSVLSGVKPGPELKAIQGEAGARGTNPVDYQADLLTAPIDRQGRLELKDLNKSIGQDVRDYGASPAGAQKRPVTDLLNALTDEYSSNVSRETGRPLAGSGAKLDFLRENIRDMSDIRFTLQTANGKAPKGAVRMSYQEAAKRGYDVEREAQEQLSNPAMAGMMDVIIRPAEYNAEETIQAIRNLDDRLAALRSPVGPGVAVSPKVNAQAHSLTDQFPGLPEMRAGHAASKGEMADKLYSAGINDKAFVGAPEQRPVFQQLLGYGDRGRQPAQDTALQDLASKLPEGKRQLQLLQALKALERLKGESLPPFQIRPSGKPGLSLPKRAIATRGDPLLELLMGAPVPLGRTIGEEESR